MPNVFDQFDTPANPFDQFDQVPTYVNADDLSPVGVDPATNQPHGVPEFVPVGVEGYDPASGEVTRPGYEPSRLTAGLTSALEGVPIIGPYLQSGAEHGASAIGSAITGVPREEVLDEMRGQVDQSQEAYPYTSAASGVAGAVVGTIPAVMAAPTFFGAGGGGLLARSLWSAGSGAAVGGADSAVRSDGELRATGKGALAGGGMGLVGPLAGRAIGAGWQRVRDFRAARQAAGSAGLDPAALSRVGRAARDDGYDPAALSQRMQELGPDAMVMDLGPNLQRQAGALAATPGAGQEIIRSSIAARDAAANSRIGWAVDDALGPAVVPSRVDAAIRENQQALGPAYEQAFRNARAVDTTSLAHSLESAAVNLRGPAQKAARDVRQMLNIIGTDELDPNPYTLFQTRQAIDGLLSSTADTNAIRVLSNARRQVDDALGQSVPGIKEVDAQFAELARQREAVTRGQQVLDSGRTAPRPQELADEFQQGALPQGQQIGPSAGSLRLREGARAEIDRIVGTNANDRVALQRIIKGEGDWNRARLATLFGQERADRIINVLDRERLFAETSNIVTRNSETAARSAAMREVDDGAGQHFGVREGYMSGGFMGAARSTGIRALEALVSSLRSSSQEAGNRGLAQALSSRDRAVIQALASSVAPGVNLGLIDEVTRALLVGGGTGAARP